MLIGSIGSTRTIIPYLLDAPYIDSVISIKTPTRKTNIMNNTYQQQYFL